MIRADVIIPTGAGGYDRDWIDCALPVAPHGKPDIRQARRSADRPYGWLPFRPTVQNTPRRGYSRNTMEENKARRVVDALRDHGTDADLARVGLYQFGVSVKLSGGREAMWDSDGTAALEAQVMRNGMLVGYVPAIEGSDDYTEQQIIDTILRTDYDKPVAAQRRTAPPPAPPLPRKGGIFRRFMDGFRYR
jgi:hypothetical protein